MSPAPIVLEVPDLADDRLKLRAWQRDDAPALVAAWADPVIVAGSTPPADRSPAAASKWIAGCDKRRRAGIALDLVIISADAGDETVGDAAGDEVLGEVGLSRLDPSRRTALIGWWIGEAARGTGVATGAVSLFTDWALGAGRLRALIAEIGADNEASIRVAEAAGYIQIKNPRNPQAPVRGAIPRVWYVAHSTVK